MESNEKIGFTLLLYYLNKMLHSGKKVNSTLDVLVKQTKKLSQKYKVTHFLAPTSFLAT